MSQCFLFPFMADMSHFCGATDTPGSDFWRRLPSMIFHVRIVNSKSILKNLS